MIEGLPPIQPYRPAAQTRASTRVALPGLAGVETPDRSVPATPPPEVLHALDKAQQVLGDLAKSNVTLHFEMAGSRVVIQVKDADGNVVREIPPKKLLDLLAGDTSAGVVVDREG